MPSYETETSMAPSPGTSVCPGCGGVNGVHVWAGSGSCPEIKRSESVSGSVTGYFYQKLAGKDAEIERLKAALAVEKDCQLLTSLQNDYYRKLLTELADTLNRYIDPQSENGLIQRAREAVK